MAKEALLESQIQAGRELLKTLDHDQIDIQSAVWMYHSENEKWKLLLFSPQFHRKNAIDEYSRLFTELMKTSASGELPYESLQLVFDDDRLVPILKAFATVKGESMVRLGSTYLNGQFIEDALIYRNAIH